jgi:hypothetical protein
MLNTLNFSKYKRFFAFGCSFTQYFWPTWADIIAKEIPESYNYGKSGGGNSFILYSLMEAHAKFNISKEDLVLIMWTNVTREDRYVNNHWITPGNIFTQSTYSDEFVEKFADIRGYYIRDLANIQAAKLCLDQTGADYDFMSMVPIMSPAQYSYEPTTEFSDIELLYKDTINSIKPSIFETLHKFQWGIFPQATGEYVSGKPFGDMHPTPDLHLSYILKTYPGTNFSEDSISFVNKHTALLLTDGIISNNRNYYYYNNPNIPERL